MADPSNKFTQPDDDTPFGKHLKEVTKYLNIGLPSFMGTFSTSVPEEERWTKSGYLGGPLCQQWSLLISTWMHQAGVLERAWPLRES